MDRHVKWLRRRIIASVSTQAAETFAVVAFIAFVLMQWRTAEGLVGSLLAAVVIGQLVVLARIWHAARTNELNYKKMRDFVERPFTYRVTRFQGEDEEHPVAQGLPGFAPVATIRDEDTDPEPIFDVYHDPSRLVAASVCRVSGAVALISSLADGRVLVTDASVSPPHERLVLNPAESDDVQTIISAHRRAITSRGDIVELASSAHQVVLDSLTLEYESLVRLGPVLSPFFDSEPRGRFSPRLAARIKHDELRDLPVRLGPDLTPATGPAHPAASQWGFGDIISPNGRATPVEPGTEAALKITERIVEALVETDSVATDAAAPIVAPPDIASPDIAYPDIVAPDMAPVDMTGGVATSEPAVVATREPAAVVPAPPGVEGVPVFAAIDAGAAELTDLVAAPAQISSPEVVQLETAALAASESSLRPVDPSAGPVGPVDLPSVGPVDLPSVGPVDLPPVGPTQFKTVEPEDPEHFVSSEPATADVPAVGVGVAPASADVPAPLPVAEVEPETGLLPMPAPVTVAPAEPPAGPLPASPVATPQRPLATPLTPLLPAAAALEPPATLAEAVVAAPDTPAALTEGVYIPSTLGGPPQTHDPVPALAAAVSFPEESERPRPRLSAALKSHPAAPPAPTTKRGRRKSR